MKYLIFETPKAGLPDIENEDSVQVQLLEDNKALVSMSDGATTGVFSKRWSDHITKNVNEKWLSSSDNFASGLSKLRDSFKPDIKRPSALRKFLLEGSYATLMSVLLEKTGWIFTRINITSFCVGDICLMVFNREGKLEYSFPYRSQKDFNNVPALLRSSEKLQAKTPIAIEQSQYTAHANDLIVITSDALGEFLFANLDKAKQIVKEISGCEDNKEFRNLIDRYRKNEKMNNDDVTAFFYSASPEYYFEKDS